MISSLLSHKNPVKINEMSKEKKEIKFDISSILNKVLWVVVFASMSFMAITFLDIRKDVQQIKIERAVENSILNTSIKPQIDILMTETSTLRDNVNSIKSLNGIMETRIQIFDVRFDRIDNRLDRILELISKN